MSTTATSPRDHERRLPVDEVRKHVEQHHSVETKSVDSMLPFEYHRTSLLQEALNQLHDVLVVCFFYVWLECKKFLPCKIREYELLVGNASSLSKLKIWKDQ